MAGGNFEKYKSDGSLGGNVLEWVDARFPATSMWKGHLSEYYAPKNFNFWYFFGSLALLVLVIQIVTGIFLVMHYKPDAALNAAGVPVAFASVEYIMRDVPGGWLIRYMHSTGASAFFIVVYLHMFRGLIYGSYRKPRELTWLFGVGIFLVLMGEAFFGYLLPWGQMSYWGAQVIVNLFGAIPVVGNDLSILIRGDFVVGDATLNRFFSFHVIAFPLVLIGLVAAHILALHETGSNNPDGIEIKENKDENGIPRDGIPFHPVLHGQGHRRRRRLPDGFLGGHVLRAGRWWFVPGNAELLSGRSAEDPAAHRAGLVFHAVLLDPACHRLELLRSRCQVLGRGGHGRLGCDLRLPALAGSQPGEVDPLSRSDHQGDDCPVRDLLLHPRLSGYAVSVADG
jgi:hypothetical protein